MTVVTSLKKSTSWWHKSKSLKLNDTFRNKSWAFSRTNMAYITLEVLQETKKVM